MRIGDRSDPGRGRDDAHARDGLEALHDVIVSGPDHQILLQIRDPGLSGAQRLGQGDDDLGRQLGNAQRFAVEKPLYKLERMLNALASTMPNSASWLRIMFTS